MELGFLPTKTGVELRGPNGGATLPAATAMQAGVMTAEHVKMLERLHTWHRTAATALPGQTVVLEREPEPIDLTPLREEMAQRLTDVLSKIQADVSRQIEAVRQETRKAIGTINPSHAAGVIHDPAPLRDELHAELARVREDMTKRIETTAPPADLAPIRKELSERMEAVFTAMQQEADRKLEQIMADTDRRILLALEVLGVLSRAQAQEPIDLGAVPTLASELRERGLPVDEQHIIAVADEHAARIYQRTAA